MDRRACWRISASFSLASLALVALGQRPNSFSGLVTKVGGSIIPRAEVRIEGGGSTITSDSGEFEFPLSGKFKPGFLATFHVKDWVVTLPCEVTNGSAYLPAPDSPSIKLLVLKRGDPRLKSGASIGCMVFEAVSRLELPDVSRIGEGSKAKEQSRSTQMHFDRYGGSEINREGDASFATPIRGVMYQSSAARESQQRGARNNDGTFDATRTAFLKRKAEELGFSVSELEVAIEGWGKSADDLYSQGQISLYHADYQRAQFYLSKAIDLAHGTVLSQYILRANAEYELGLYSLAEADLRNVLTVQPDNPIALNNLGAVLFREANKANLRSEADRFRAEALSLLTRVMTLDEGSLAPNSLSIGMDYFNLAQLYMSMHQLESAEHQFERLLKFYDDHAFMHNIRWAEAISNLSVLYLNDFDNSKAMSQEKVNAIQPKLEEALKIVKNTLSDDMEIAILQMNLAGIYKTQKKYAEAEKLMRDSLPVYLSHYGKENGRLALYYYDLADLCARQGQYENAEPLYEHALSLAKTGWLKSDAPFIADVAEGLAVNLSKLGRDEEAKTYRDEADRIRKGEKSDQEK